MYHVLVYSTVSGEKEYSRRKNKNEARQDLQHVAYWWKAAGEKVKDTGDRIECHNRLTGYGWAVYYRVDNTSV